MHLDKQMKVQSAAATIIDSQLEFTEKKGRLSAVNAAKEVSVTKCDTWSGELKYSQTTSLVEGRSICLSVVLGVRIYYNNLTVKSTSIVFKRTKVRHN